MTLFSFNGIAQDNVKTINLAQKHFNTNKDHLALEGYDPVTYFTGKPSKGKSSFSFVAANGIKYYFVSQANLNTFKATPEKYEPAFGGWCAYAMGAKGEKVEVDPENYKIVNGKNYLFYKSYFSNTIDDWNKDSINLDKKAIVNWNKLFK